MLNKIQISILSLSLCVGCDTAIKQQQAEAARRAATAAHLKQIGEAANKNQNKEPAPSGTPDPAPEKSKE